MTTFGQLENPARAVIQESPFWIQTRHGHQFHYENPDPAEIDIRDIAYSLSNQIRFTGHCNPGYTVAEHCVRASYLVPVEDAFAALMHDSTEAYVTDLAKPLKMLIGPAYAKYEDLAWQAICTKFNINPALPPSIKDADLTLLITERRDLFHFVIPSSLGKDGGSGYEPLEDRIEPWHPLTARQKFLDRFYELYQPWRSDGTGHF